MLGVAIVAIALALLTPTDLSLRPLIACTAVFGAFTGRWLGGKGIVGGAIGGVVGFWSDVAYEKYYYTYVEYDWFHFVNYVTPDLVVAVTTVAGTIYGTVIGVITWGAIESVRVLRKA